MTDSTGINIASLPKDMQKNIIQDFYGKKGIEFSIGRIPIGGSDFSTRPYSYDDDHKDDFNLTYFALQKEDNLYKVLLSDIIKEFFLNLQLTLKYDYS